jgi:hypothetical protein
MSLDGLGARSGLRSAPPSEPTGGLSGGAFGLLIPNLRPDARSALRDMRVRGIERSQLEQQALQQGLSLVDGLCADPYDDTKTPDRAFTMLRGPGLDIALLQIDDWIAADGTGVATLHEIAYAFRGRRVCVVAKGVDAPARGLLTLLRGWREREGIDAEFIFWRYVTEAAQGIETLRSVFAFELTGTTPVARGGVGGQAQPRIFISYAHKDEKWLACLQDMLAPITRQFPTAIWSDAMLVAGDRWANKIDQALTSSRVVILLVSPAFLASEFIHDQELGPILAAAREGRKQILWILVSDCLWRHTAIKDYQAAHDIKTPLDRLRSSRRNEQLAMVGDKLLEFLKS